MLHVWNVYQHWPIQYGAPEHYELVHKHHEVQLYDVQSIIHHSCCRYKPTERNLGCSTLNPMFNCHGVPTIAGVLFSGDYG